MHLPHLREEALRLHAEGIPLAEIYRRVGVPRNTVKSWLYDKRAAAPKLTLQCARCARPSRPMGDPQSYAYLLGQYLGDGHLLMTQRMPVLRVTCDTRYPGIIHEVAYAMEACGARTAGFTENPGCVNVRAYWTHWPCLIPQHGPGLKHLRKIELQGWQQEIVDGHHQRFLRGLFHSDGSRFLNQVAHKEKTYTYLRYMFVNESADIMGLCQRSLDALGISWRMTRHNTLSVARREDVARLDTFVGPKW